MSLLQDKVVVVSGIGPGLGQAIALRAAAHGADLVLAARTASKLEEVAAQVDALGRKAICVPTDITTDDGNLANAATEAFGRIDVLVSNAFAMPTMRDLSKVDVDAVRQSFETNVIGTLRLTRSVAAAMKQGGAIVMVNSAVLRHSRRTFGTYKMAKASLLAMAQNLASELGGQGIRVNSVAPSYIWNDQLRTYFEYLGAKRGITGQEVYDELAATTDLGRLAEPDEIADTIVFLASDMARAVTGQCLDVNCGEFHR